jgi:hypothetical protein
MSAPFPILIMEEDGFTEVYGVIELSVRGLIKRWKKGLWFICDIQNLIIGKLR